MYCGQCGKDIDTDSRFCRFCGANQESRAVAEQLTASSASKAHDTVAFKLRQITVDPKKNRAGVAIGWMVGVVILFAIISSINKSSNTTTRDNSTDVVANATATAPASPNVVASSTTTTGTSPKPEPVENWVYSTDEDKLHGGTSYFASTTSTNTVHQSSPYDSDTNMRMTVRRMSSGTDVVLKVSSGQLMCPSYEGCSGTVRFDSSPAQHVRFEGAADDSSETIFVAGAKGFIAKLKRAKKVIIAKTLYQAGEPQFEFDVSGLKWNH